MLQAECPINNVCPQTAGTDVACGRTPEHLPPLPLAEKMCTFALAGQVEYEATNPDEWLPARRSLRQAWAEVEMGLATPTDDASAADHFNNARNHLDQSLDDSHFDVRFDAGILDAYIPSFRARQQGEGPLIGRQRMALRRYLGGMIEKIEESSVHEDEQWGFYTKAVLHLLLSRSGLPYYPASAREGRSRGYSALNHDGYVIRDDGKIPIKTRGSSRNREYSDRLLFLPYNQLAVAALKEATGRASVSGAVAAESIGLLEREACGEVLGGHENRLVENLTRRVVQKVEAYTITH